MRKPRKSSWAWHSVWPLPTFHQASSKRWGSAASSPSRNLTAESEASWLQICSVDWSHVASPNSMPNKSTKHASRTSMLSPHGQAQKQPSQPTQNSTLPAHHPVGRWDWRLRHYLPQLHASRPPSRARSEPMPAIRPAFLHPTLHIRVARQHQHTPHYPTGRGWRAGAAIQAVHSQLHEGESLYAYLDDVYAMVEPHKVKPVYDLLAHHLYTHAHIQLNSGKTRVWNLAGVPPPNLEPLGADVWVGNPALPPEQRGLTVLGAPLGTPEYQRHHLSQTRASHQALLDDIPSLDDLQASWLLLLYCASPRCNYLLRMLPPTTTRQYAQDHDLAVLSCLTTLLDAANLPATTVALAHLPLHLGGLGLTSATITAAPLYRQARQQATTLLQQLQAEMPATPSIQALTQAMDQLQRHGFEPPSWADLVQGSAPPTQLDAEQRLLGRGWQRPAALASHQAFRTELTASLDPASQAMLQSQSGPYASRTFTTIPFGLDTTYPSHLFRVLLLRRLRLPLRLSARICRCRRTLDPLGGHRAACAQAGVLRGRGIPLGRAAARVCREAGARVTTNTRLSDLNLDHINRHDDRRIEVIANGLPLWGGAQLAVDTTLVSPLTSSSQPRRRAGQYAGAALQDARKSKERTYPELLRSRRCRLVVLALETGGRWSPEATTFLRPLAQTKARAVPNILRNAVEASLLSRWSAILTHAAQHAFAASLLDLDCAGTSTCDGDTPSISQLLSEAPLPPPPTSRLPARP